jgi:hypothetical protein
MFLENIWYFGGVFGIFSVFFRTFQKVFPLETESDFYQSIIAGESGEKVLVQTSKFFFYSQVYAVVCPNQKMFYFIDFAVKCSEVFLIKY